MLAMGEEDRIRLKTNNGKVGYKITKFQIIGNAPGNNNSEYVGKITKVTDTNIGPTVDLTDSDILAVVYNSDSSGWGGTLPDSAVILDNEVVNQDIFVNISDASGATNPCNYFIELEAMALTDLETTKLTLQSIRQILS